MIYKAFLNRQEITGFPVKGKETSEIWGGDILLWKKNQVKKYFTVETYLPSSRLEYITNGNYFSTRVTLPSSTEKWATFNNKEPYTHIRIDVGGHSNIKVHGMAEIGGAICYLKSEIINTSSMRIIIKSLIGESEVINAYIYTSESSCGLVSAAWLMNNCIYCHFTTGSSDDGTRCHIVLKFNTNGELLEEYKKAIPDRDEAYNYKFPITEGPYTTIKSGSLYYAARLQYPAVYMYKLNENPFEISPANLTNLNLYYIGSCNNRHIFGDFSKDNETIIYELIGGEFIKKKVLPYGHQLSPFTCCLCKNHIYGAEYFAEIYDFGSIDADPDRKLIYTIPFSATISIHYVQSQADSIYVFYGGSSEEHTQYMTIISI